MPENIEKVMAEIAEEVYRVKMGLEEIKRDENEEERFWKTEFFISFGALVIRYRSNIQDFDMSILD